MRSAGTRTSGETDSPVEGCRGDEDIDRDTIVAARIARLTIPARAVRRGRVPDALSPGVKNLLAAIPPA
jgi:hypothetical protein